MSEAQDVMNKLLQGVSVDDEGYDEWLHELQHLAADKAEDEFLAAKAIQGIEDQQRGK